MLSVRNLTKIFPARAGSIAAPAIGGISFDVAKGEFFTLLGPSGCGKTTTLQCIAGLETPTSGVIEMDGQTVFASDRNVYVPANLRSLGMVFQSYAIWPHLSVFDNVAFPLVHGPKRTPSGDVRRRVLEALSLVKLQDFADRPSPHLSGGQQQRVALARALVNAPKILLLDEPLSNLDAKLRDAMRVEIRQLVKSLGITTIFVTHDQLEAMSMSDTIVLLQAGRIVQQGPPRDVYLRPTAAFSADFMGRSNLLPGTLNAQRTGVATAFGEVACTAPSAVSAGAAVFLVVRPHVIGVTAGAKPNGSVNVFQGRVDQQSFLGDTVEADVSIGESRFRAVLDPYLDIADGADVWLTFPPERCVVVPGGASAS